MNKPTIYLAGPITGLSYDGATDWREETIRAFENEITCFSPLRAKTYLAGLKNIPDSGTIYSPFPLSSQRGIFCRDSFDVNRCDLLLVNLLGADRVSIGTVMEIAWAAQLRKPIVAAMEDNNIHNHAMIREAMPFIVPTLDDALHLTRCILLPDPIR